MTKGFSFGKINQRNLIDNAIKTVYGARYICSTLNHSKLINLVFTITGAGARGWI